MELHDVQTELREKYKLSPKSIKFFERENTTKYKEAFLEEELNKISCKIYSWTIAELNKIEETEEGFNISKLLAYLDPQIVFDEFGEETLFWAWNVYNIGCDLHDKLTEAYCKLSNRDIDIIKKARLGTWRNSYFTDTTTLWNYARILEKTDDEINLIGLEKLISNYPKYNGGYSFEKVFACTEGKGMEKTSKSEIPKLGLGNIIHTIYVDAPIGIKMIYKNIPTAIISFVPKDPKTIIIKQLQGIQGKEYDLDGENVLRRHQTHGLSNFDWRKTLIEIVSYISKSEGFTRIGILGAHNSPWTEKNKDKKPHSTTQRLLQCYDNVAERLEFVQDEKKNWYKII